MHDGLSNGVEDSLAFYTWLTTNMLFGGPSQDRLVLVWLHTMRVHLTD